MIGSVSFVPFKVPWRPALGYTTVLAVHQPFYISICISTLSIRSTLRLLQAIHLWTSPIVYKSVIHGVLVLNLGIYVVNLDILGPRNNIYPSVSVYNLYIKIQVHGNQVKVQT